MKVQRVLIPTDLSEKSNAALKSINSFIEAFDCIVDVMHVIPLSRYLNDSFDRLGVPLNMEKEVYPKLIENKREELNNFFTKYITNEKNRGEVLISIDRKPSDSVLEQTKKKDYDLIMMSAKGEHADQFFHGSATDKIIRHSKVPVLTLAEHLVPAKLNTIVVPCDFSNTSLAALPLAFDLAIQFGAKLELLHVIELYAADIQGIEPTVVGVDDNAVYNSIVEQVRSFFKDFAAAEFTLTEKDEIYEDTLHRELNGTKESVEVRTVIVKGVAAHHEIIDYANGHADMLVMSTHGRSGFSRMLLGSTTEQVVQHVNKPQLTIKPQLED
ncbi:MAG: universal stress protein [Balneolaceae bacterium]